MKNETINEEVKTEEQQVEETNNQPQEEKNQTEAKEETCHCEHEKCHRDKKHIKCNGKEHHELEEAKKMIQELQAANMDLQEKLMISRADSINYRKRKDEEVANLLKFANQDLIVDLLEMIENLDRASQVKCETEEAMKIKKGIEMTSTQFKNILSKYGVVEIEALGYPFDPNYMEAMMVAKDETKPDGIVLEVLIKGYKLKEKVIKHSVVKVNKLED